MTNELLLLERLSEAEREQLRLALNLLFTEGLLVRSIDQHARAYRFVLANTKLCETYLGYAGWTLRVDETLGVIAFVGPAAARLRLRKNETIMALIVRLFYEEKAGEITLHGERTVRRHEIQDRFQSLTKSTLKKTPFLTILRRLQALRLIQIAGDDDDPEATVVLYPSLAFVIDATVVEELEARLADLLGSETSDEDDDEEE
ncbi:MAG: DUF4194 domain-containing protein [Spirochaetales bacterium]